MELIAYYEDRFNFFMEKLKRKPDDKNLKERLLDIIGKVKKMGTRHAIIKVVVMVNNKRYEIYYSNITMKDIKTIIKINHKDAEIISIKNIKPGTLLKIPNG